MITSSLLCTLARKWPFIRGYAPGRAKQCREDDIIRDFDEVADEGGSLETPSTGQVVWVQHSDEEHEKGSCARKIVPELKPSDAEHFIEKNYGDSFEETTLEMVLSNLGVGDSLLPVPRRSVNVELIILITVLLALFWRGRILHLQRRVVGDRRGENAMLDPWAIRWRLSRWSF